MQYIDIDLIKRLFSLETKASSNYIGSADRLENSQIIVLDIIKWVSLAMSADADTINFWSFWLS
jgi:hypothetical protein